MKYGIYKRKDNFNRNLMLFGVIVFFLSNAYFGWNKNSQSGLESMFDVIWVSCTFGGGFWFGVEKIVEEILSRTVIIEE